MTYTVKEIFYTLQGEGAQTGRAAVFCRFSGCNLWSGREEDRSRAVCQFCDTDFVGTGPDGGKFKSAKALAGAVAGDARPFEDLVDRVGEPRFEMRVVGAEHQAAVAQRSSHHVEHRRMLVRLDIGEDPPGSGVLPGQGGDDRHIRTLSAAGEVDQDWRL